MLALTCLLMVSCGNMGQVMSAMTNGTGIANAVKSVIGLDKLKAQQESSAADRRLEIQRARLCIYE